MVQRTRPSLGNQRVPPRSLTLDSVAVGEIDTTTERLTRWETILSPKGLLNRYFRSTTWWRVTQPGDRMYALCAGCEWSDSFGSVNEARTAHARHVVDVLRSNDVEVIDAVRVYAPRR